MYGMFDAAAAFDRAANAPWYTALLLPVYWPPTTSEEEDDDDE